MRYRIMKRSDSSSLYFVQAWHWSYWITQAGVWRLVRKPENEIGNGPLYGWNTKEEAMRFIDRLVAGEVKPSFEPTEVIYYP